MFSERITNDEPSAEVEALIGKLMRIVDASLSTAPAEVDRAYVRAAIVPVLRFIAEQKFAKAPGPAVAPMTPQEEQEGVEEAELTDSRSDEGGELIAPSRNPRQRYNDNIAAIQKLVAWERDGKPPLSRIELGVIRGFSGWGGLTQLVWNSKSATLEGAHTLKIRQDIPEGFPLPNIQQLAWEYYTPEKVASAIADLLQSKVDEAAAATGKARILEPSVGVGRLLIPFVRTKARASKVECVAVEMDRIGSRIAAGSLPGVKVNVGPFEKFAGDVCDGSFDIVVSNPPYGKRIRSKFLDNVLTAETENYHYFIKRCATALRAGGTAVFFVPNGLLTGSNATMQNLRTWVLRRFHLEAAFRLPSKVWDGGASISCDVLVLNRRAGCLAGVAMTDEAILDGRYFKDFPAHLLGVEGVDGRNRYFVEGEFDGFPDYEPRPVYEGTDYITDPDLPVFGSQEATRESQRAKKSRGIVETAEAEAEFEVEAMLDSARALGRRLAKFDIQRSDSVENAAIAQAELLKDFEVWSKAHGNPRRTLGGPQHSGDPDLRYLRECCDTTGKLVARFTDEVDISDAITAGAEPSLKTAILALIGGSTKPVTLSNVIAKLREQVQAYGPCPAAKIVEMEATEDGLRRVVELLWKSDFRFRTGAVRFNRITPTGLDSKGNQQFDTKEELVELIVWAPRERAYSGNLFEMMRTAKRILDGAEYRPEVSATTTQFDKHRDQLEETVAAPIMAELLTRQKAEIDELVPIRSLGELNLSVASKCIPIDILEEWLNGSRWWNFGGHLRAIDPSDGNSPKRFDASPPVDAPLRGPIKLVDHETIRTAYLPRDRKEAAIRRTRLDSQSFKAALALHPWPDIPQRPEGVTRDEFVLSDAWLDYEKADKQVQAERKAYLKQWNYLREATYLGATEGKGRVRDLLKRWMGPDSVADKQLLAACREEVAWRDSQSTDGDQAWIEPSDDPMPLNTVGFVFPENLARVFGIINAFHPLLGGTFRASKVGDVEAELEKAAAVKGYQHCVNLDFMAWLGERPDYIARVIEAYREAYLANRQVDDSTPEIVPRWKFPGADGGGRNPAAYQWRSAKRLLAWRGGTTALDVGLGKTTVALLAIAMARQRGELRRVAFLAPQQTLVSLSRDFAEVMPDFTVCIMGFSTKRDRSGELVVRPDSVKDRLAKYAAIARGDFEVTLFSYEDAMRTGFSQEELNDYSAQNAALQDLLAKREDTLAKQDANAHAVEKGKVAAMGGMSLSKLQVSSDQVGVFLESKLISKTTYDPSWKWSDLGFDAIFVDEAQNFKNLYTPNEEDTGGVMKFIGSPGSESKRAWQLDFRAYLVRRRGGQIFFLSATPAKNSPLEFFSLIMMTNPNALHRRSLSTITAFQDRYLRQQTIPFSALSVTAEHEEDAGGEKESKPASAEGGGGKKRATAEACVGWNNVEEMRALLAETMDIVYLADVPGQLRRPVPTPTVQTFKIAAKGVQFRIMEAMRNELREWQNSPPEKTKGWLQAVGMSTILSLLDTAAIHPALVQFRRSPAGEEAREKYPSLVAELERFGFPELDPKKRAKKEAEKKKRRGNPASDEAWSFWEGEEPDEPMPRVGAAAFREFGGRTDNPKGESVDVTSLLQFESRELGYFEAKKAIANAETSLTTAKLDKLVEEVIKTMDANNTLNCGHIIFCEQIAAHAFVEARLIEAGVDPKRIAVANGQTVKSPQEKSVLSDRFCGDWDWKAKAWKRGDDGKVRAPDIDIMIGNVIITEGINLQTRTCAIHHLDLKWEPASLQQRNGRGVRQGNTLSAIAVNYYITRQCREGLKFAHTQGKRGWLIDLIKGADLDQNNPNVGGMDVPMDVQRQFIFCRDDDEENLIAGEWRKRQAAEDEKRKRSMLANQVGDALVTLKAVRGQSTERGLAMREASLQRIREGQTYAADIWPYQAELAAALSGKMVVLANAGEWPVAEDVILVEDGKPAYIGVVPRSYQCDKPPDPNSNEGAIGLTAYWWPIRKEKRYGAPYNPAVVVTEQQAKNSYSIPYAGSMLSPRNTELLQKLDSASSFLAQPNDYADIAKMILDKWEIWAQENKNAGLQSDSLRQLRYAPPALVQAIWQETAKRVAPKAGLGIPSTSAGSRLSYYYVGTVGAPCIGPDGVAHFALPKYVQSADFTCIDLQAFGNASMGSNGMIYLFEKDGALCVKTQMRGLSSDNREYDLARLMVPNAYGAAEWLAAGNPLWSELATDELLEFKALFTHYFGIELPSDWRTQQGASLQKRVSNPRRNRA